MGAADQPVGLAEKIAWGALVATPALVPLAVSKPLFSDARALTLNLYVIPKVFTFATLIGVALVAWAVGVSTGAIKTRTVPLLWWLAGFLGIAAVSTAFGMHPTTSFFGGAYHAAGFLVLMLGAAVYLLVTQLAYDAGRIRALSWSVVGGGAVVALVGLLQSLDMDPLRLFDPRYPYLTTRGGSLLGNPDFTGSYLVVPVVVALALALSSRPMIDRVIAYVCFVLTLVGMLNTGTRGAWFGAAVGLLALGVALSRSKVRVPRSAYAAAGIAVAAPLLWIAANQERFLARLSDLTKGTAVGGGRLAIWTDALSVIARHPLLGTGPDAYRLGWYGVRSIEWVKTVGTAVINEDPHNMVLLFAATLGIPAAILAMGLVGAALFGSARDAFGNDAKTGRLLYAGWWATLLGFATTLLFTTNNSTVMVMLFMALAIVGVVRSATVDLPAWGRVVAVSMAALLGVTAVVVGGLYLASDAKLMAAEVLPDKVALTAQAARIAPFYGKARYRAAMAGAEQALAQLDAGQPAGVVLAQSVTAEFERLVAWNPDEYEYRTGQAYFLTNAGRSLGSRTLEDAVAAGDAALKLSPMNPQAAYLKAFAQYNLADYQGAIATLRPVWDIDRKYVDAGTIYFRALVAAHNLSEATRVLAVLEGQFPGNPEVTVLSSLLETTSTAN